MNREQFYISTIASDDAVVARQYGLGLEIAEYCTAYRMDADFPETDRLVRGKLEGIQSCTFHAPFNELFPCAIDPKARELARSRYFQAIELARGYGAVKVVIHGGYHPKIYYPCWYTEQSILFWRDFLRKIPDGVTICLENVLEEEPGMLVDILQAVDDPRLRMCLDVGHVNAYSAIPAMEWVERCAPYLSHLHIHNNPGNVDSHQDVFAGTVPMLTLLQKTQQLCPEATVTLEVPRAEPSVRWLVDSKILIL